MWMVGTGRYGTVLGDELKHSDGVTGLWKPVPTQVKLFQNYAKLAKR